MEHGWVAINEYELHCPHCGNTVGSWEMGLYPTPKTINTECTPKVHPADSESAKSAWDLAEIYGGSQPPTPRELEAAVCLAERDGWVRVGTSNVPPNQGYEMWIYNK